jgi:hypothetical protein
MTDPSTNNEPNDTFRENPSFFQRVINLAPTVIGLALIIGLYRELKNAEQTHAEQLTKCETRHAIYVQDSTRHFGQSRDNCDERNTRNDRNWRESYGNVAKELAECQAAAVAEQRQANSKTEASQQKPSIGR